MKIVGIIAEYNPFHNGHAYQIQKARELANADYVVVVMSPDFVQRGEPAFLDKFCRTEMALQGGADLILELPVCYAAGSAEYFAEGATSLLHALGCVDVLSFGCETTQPSLFSPLADFLLEEPEEYRRLLCSYQKSGMTYPKARETALLETFPKKPEDPSLLSSPNNILGLEYTKALKKQNSTMSLLPIPRVGSGYHSLSFDREFCSASAIRSALSADSASAPCQLESLRPFLPEHCRKLLEEKVLSSALTAADHFSALLHYKLLTEAPRSFRRYLDVTPDLSDRILRLLPQYHSFSRFVSLLKTKQLTETRIRRALLHILLDITLQDTERFRLQGPVFYARILGFRKTAGPLMHTIKTHTSIPLIAKPADAKNILDGSALQMFTQDVHASHIYRLPSCSRAQVPMISEYTRSPIIVS